ncbi:MAG: HD domain-containing phosphohydrolase [Chloroflexota bacterium]
MENIIAFLERLIGIRDTQGNSHGQHVTQLASVLARKIDFPSAELSQLEYAATIHDVGKITVNDFIINKPGRLTEAEYIMIQQHTALGHKLLEPLGLPRIVMEVVLHHHENFDGSGYPHSLAGEKIPLEARIIRITDTYDALVSYRGYRPVMSRSKALDTMIAVAENFDPELLEVFLKMKIPNKPAGRHA